MKSNDKLRIRAVARQLLKNLLQLNPDILPISTYNKRYLATHQAQAAYILSIYCRILETVCLIAGKPLRNITLVDYGAGTGLLGILAKKAGFGKVIYCDNYAVSKEDAKHIASALGIVLDQYLCGDTTILMLEHRGRIDALVSMDVIEHVYNLDTFFEHCSQLGSGLMMVHVTGSNTKNPFSVKTLSAFQRQCEQAGISPVPGSKDIDRAPSYLSMRRDIISAQADLSLNDAEITTLATLTRGYDKTDILKALYQYRMTGNLPEPISHPTNTCNPETGNWAERLTSEQEMMAYARPYGFTMNWQPLYYNTYRKSGLKQLVQSMLNSFITLAGNAGLFLAPLVMMVFKKR